MKLGSNLRILLTAGLGIILFSLSTGCVAGAVKSSKVSYPEGLEFLAKLTPPPYYFARGYLEGEAADGKKVVEMPLEFYWEKGAYILDIRMPGGAPALMVNGLADTVSVYDFMHGKKITVLRKQSLGGSSPLPFRADDILSMFNLFPQGFQDIDTFYKAEDVVVVKFINGTRYEFSDEPKRLRKIIHGNDIIETTNFQIHKNMAFPKQIEINKGFLVSEAQLMRIVVTKLSFERKKNDNPLKSLDFSIFRMPSELDLRVLETGYDEE